MFSQTTDYALRAVSYLANCADHASTIPLMAEAIAVNVPYLRKVVAKLSDAEIVESHRGKGGGVHLAVDPQELTLLEVVNAVSPVERITSCPLGQPDHVKLCALHTELDEMIGQIEQLLASRTIGQLLTQRRHASRCSFPKCEEVYQL